MSEKKNENFTKNRFPDQVYASRFKFHKRLVYDPSYFFVVQSPKLLFKQAIYN